MNVVDNISNGTSTPSNQNWQQTTNTEFLEGFITGIAVVIAIWIIAKIIKIIFKKILEYVQKEK